jgi:Strictosidine synthase
VIGALREFANRFLGRGDATIAVPSFDGALKPNQKIEEAEVLLECAAPEDLTTDGRAIYLADGPRLLRLDGGSATELRVFEAAISALASLPGGELAVALGGREVRIFPDPSAAKPRAVFAAGLSAVNALVPAPEGILIATDGSTTRGVDQWAWDLMENGHSGRVWLLDPATGSSKALASGLGYAFGCCATGDGVLVSESWRHRLIKVRRDGSTNIALPHLPVYPSRLSPASPSGYWLTAFTARSLLVEFVLREPAFRKRMMAEIEPRYWIVPRLHSGDSFKEPMQGAHIRTMGVVKPWAPPRSYGLVIRLGDDATPLYSLHSRVDGVNHGVVSAIEVNGDLIVIAKGPGRVLKLPIALLDKELGA